MHGRLLVFIVSMLALSQVPFGESTSSWSPGIVIAVSAGTDAAAGSVVGWTPGTEVADAYNVYGVEGSTFVLLASATQLTVAPTTGHYSAYAVAGIKGGVESERVSAIVVPCIYAELQPPPPTTSVGNCGSLMAGVYKVPGQ